jgi:orotate phosphoribosyltransferase
MDIRVFVTVTANSLTGSAQSINLLASEFRMRSGAKSGSEEVGMDKKRRRFLEILKATSFRSNPEPIFRLASGRLSKYYVDCKQALSHPEARALIADLISERLKGESIDAVGGLEIGAYPIATSVSDAIYRDTGVSVRAFVVRKEPKSHGIRDLIAGDVRDGDKAVVVDDVVTEGSSTLKAIDASRKAGLLVQRVIVLVDREEAGGRRNIEAAEVRFEALCTLHELVELPDGPDQSATREAHPGGTV